MEKIKKTEKIKKIERVDKKEVLANLPTFLNEWQKQVVSQKTPEKYIKWRTGADNKQLAYVEVSYVIDILNLAFGGDWDFTVIDKNIGNTQIWIMGRLTIRVNGKTITKENFGSSSIKRYKQSKEIIDIGNDLKTATSDALKKCASMFGVAPDVYSGRITRETKTAKITESNGYEYEYDNPAYMSREEDQVNKMVEQKEIWEKEQEYIRKKSNAQNREIREKVGQKCPECLVGTIVRKEGKFGEFFGCNRYPTCKYPSK